MSEQSSPLESICNDRILIVRLEAASQAQKRSRAAFLASTIVSLAIIITMWNAYGSWYRGFLFNEKFAVSEVTNEAQKSFIDEWVKGLKISIPVLGIQVGIGDAAVLGSISLYIICIWLYFSMRRENHIIGLLLSETKDCPPIICNMVFHGILSFGIFTNVTEFDEPITELNQSVQRKSTFSRHIVRFTYKFLIFLPAITIFAMIIMDIVSIIWLSAPLRESHAPLLYTLTRSDWGKRVVMEVIALSLFFLTRELCSKINRYSNGTENLLRQYEGSCTLKFESDS